MNDPLGDMISRIHNAQMRNKSKVSSPSSRLRVSVLDVLKTEGFIRGYAAVEHANGRKELEIELKYFEGEPVIREISRYPSRGGAFMPRCGVFPVSITGSESRSYPRPRG